MHTLAIKKIILIAGLCALASTVILWTKSQKPTSRFRAGVSLISAYRDCIDAARSQQDKGICLKDLGDYAGKNSTAAEIDAAIASLAQSEELSWCHEFLHYVGWGLYKKTKNISDAFVQANSRCDSGMFHGVVEEYISEASEGKNPEEFVTSVAPTACEGDVAKNNLLPGVKAICYHGLGHAFMFITGNNLPQSLHYCDALSPAHAGECYTGAFMENLQSKQVGRLGTHPSAYMPKAGDPDYPCNLLDEQHKDFCYRYAGIAVVVQTKGDFKKAFEYCLNVAPAYQDTCFWGVGSDIPAPQWSSREAGEKCGLALEVSARAYEQCIMGGMAFLVQLNLGNPQAVNEFCGAIKPDYRDICFQAAGANLRSWTSFEQEFIQKCNRLSSVEARRACLQ